MGNCCRTRRVPTNLSGKWVHESVGVQAWLELHDDRITYQRLVTNAPSLFRRRRRRRLLDTEDQSGCVTKHRAGAGSEYRASNCWVTGITNSEITKCCGKRFVYQGPREFLGTHQLMFDGLKFDRSGAHDMISSIASMNPSVAIVVHSVGPIPKEEAPDREHADTEPLI
jgi:hypothetical protein